MTRCRRSAALAALLLTLCLAAPGAALQGRARLAGNDTRAEATVAERGWFAAMAETAWSWIYGLWDEDNGHITP